MLRTANALRDWAEDPDRKIGDREVYFINRSGRMSAGDLGGAIFREAGKLEHEGTVLLFQKRQGDDTAYEARIPSPEAKAIIARLSRRKV